MDRLEKVMAALTVEKKRLDGELKRVRAVIAVLERIGGSRERNVRPILSRAGRARIVAAQRARWAKWKRKKKK